MKVHYINILMFAVPINILVYNQGNHKSITHHTQNENPIKTHRSLCECELFAPQNYDNDPEMKSVMQDFDRQTSQRLREYDERMNKNRQKCKDQCDKDIQKIILKDKLEKELMDKFATLHTDMQSDAIPTCICEKSVADKVEKTCLKCTQNLGGIVAPSSGVLVGIAEGALYAWKDAAIIAAKAAAVTEGAAKGLVAGAQAGIKTVMDLLGSDLSLSIEGVQKMGSVINGTNYTDVSNISNYVSIQYQWSCMPRGTGPVPVAGVPNNINSRFCKLVTEQSLAASPGNSVNPIKFIEKEVETIVKQAENTAKTVAKTATEKATTTLTAQKTGVVEATYMGYQTPIIASVVAIVVIVLVMVIIYLILRYRRKKKMKKKLQYIKLLEE